MIFLSKSGHLLTILNQHTKFQGFSLKTFWDIFLKKKNHYIRRKGGKTLDLQVKLN